MSAAQFAELRAAIVARLEGVEGIGVVHGRQRYAAEQPAFRALYTVDAGGGLRRINGWHLRRVRTAETSPTIGGAIAVHLWRIEGFLSFDDAAGSELEFDLLVERIRDAFRADPELGSAAVIPEDEGAYGVQVESSEPVMFAGHLCHGCRLSLATRLYME